MLTYKQTDKMIQSQNLYTFSLVVKHFCTKFESCTIKTIWVIVSQWKCLSTSMDYNFMWGPNKDTQALSVTWVSETIHWLLVRRAHICIHLLFHVSLPYRCYIPNLVKIDQVVLEKMLMHDSSICWCMTMYNNRCQPIANKNTKKLRHRIIIS